MKEWCLLLLWLLQAILVVSLGPRLISAKLRRPLESFIAKLELFLFFYGPFLLWVFCWVLCSYLFSRPLAADSSRWDGHNQQTFLTILWQLHQMSEVVEQLQQWLESRLRSYEYYGLWLLESSSIHQTLEDGLQAAKETSAQLQQLTIQLRDLYASLRGPEFYQQAALLQSQALALVEALRASVVSTYGEGLYDGGPWKFGFCLHPWFKLEFFIFSRLTLPSSDFFFLGSLVCELGFVALELLEFVGYEQRQLLADMLQELNQWPQWEILPPLDPPAVSTLSFGSSPSTPPFPWALASEQALTESSRMIVNLRLEVQNFQDHHFLPLLKAHENFNPWPQPGSWNYGLWSFLGLLYHGGSLLGFFQEMLPNTYFSPESFNLLHGNGALFQGLRCVDFFLGSLFSQVDEIRQASLPFHHLTECHPLIGQTLESLQQLEVACHQLGEQLDRGPETYQQAALLQGQALALVHALSYSLKSSLGTVKELSLHYEFVHNLFYLWGSLESSLLMLTLVTLEPTFWVSLPSGSLLSLSVVEVFSASEWRHNAALYEEYAKAAHQCLQLLDQWSLVVHEKSIARCCFQVAFPGFPEDELMWSLLDHSHRLVGDFRDHNLLWKLHRVVPGEFARAINFPR